MVKVLVSDPIADKGIEILEEAGFDIVYNPNPSDDELHTLASDTNAWVVRSGTKITAELLKDARNLQVIGRAGVGVDNIDIKEATNKGIIVMNNPDGNTISAAEIVFPSGLFITTIPRFVASWISILSTPTPALPIT